MSRILNEAVENDEGADLPVYGAIFELLADGARRLGGAGRL